MKQDLITAEVLQFDTLINMGFEDPLVEIFAEQFTALLESTFKLIYPTLDLSVGFPELLQEDDYDLLTMAVERIRFIHGAVANVEDAIVRKERLDYCFRRVLALWKLLVSIREYLETDPAGLNKATWTGCSNILHPKSDSAFFVTADKKVYKHVISCKEANPADVAYFRQWTDGKPKTLEATAAERDWTPEELAHAISCDDEGIDYKNEIKIELANGRVVCCPAYPEDCTYVRVVDQGYELGYWICDDWRDAPMICMGAIMGVMKGN